MFDLVTSRNGKPRDFIDLDPTCITVPPIRIILSEPHWIRRLPLGQQLSLSWEEPYNVIMK